MSKKLVIRINNLQDLDENDAYEVVEETAIRWDRVIGVIVFALLVLIAAIVGLVTVLNSNIDKSSVEPSIETVSVEPVAPNAQPVVPDMVVAEKQSASEKNTLPEPSVVDQSLSTEQDLLVVNGAEVDTKPAADETMIEVVAVETLVVETLAVEKPVVENITIENTAVTNVVAKNRVLAEPKTELASLVESINPQLAQKDPITIQSKKIVRAQLTHAVSKKEPVDKLGSTIQMTDQGLIKVFLFTDMQGLKGETLYHEWYLAGKRMAKVKINVRNNNVSASSSKFIDKYMTGDWKVNVVSQSGDALVSAQFVVAP